MNEFLLGLVASFIKSKVKKPENKRKLKNVCLEIYKAIKIAFADDEDFE